MMVKPAAMQRVEPYNCAACSKREGKPVERSIAPCPVCHALDRGRKVMEQRKHYGEN